MPTLPTKFDLPDPQGVGPVNTPTPSGGEAIGRGVASLGNAVEGVAEAEAKRTDDLAMLKWQADVVPPTEKLVDTFRERNDYQNFEPDFTKQVREIHQKALEQVRNPLLRERLALQGEIDSRGALRRVLTHGSQLRKQDEYAQADDGMAEIAAGAISPNATPEDAIAAIKQARSRADVALNGGVVDYAQHHHLIDKHITGINGVLYRAAGNRLWSEPYGTLTDLGVADKKAQSVEAAEVPVSDISSTARIRSAPRTGDIEGVVIHHTAGSTLEGALNQGKATGTGANYYIDRDGSVKQAAPDDKRTIHIQEPGHPSRTDAQAATKGLRNGNTLGIEVVAKDDADVTPQQRASLDKLLGRLETTHGIKPENVVGHGELQGGEGGNRQADEGTAAAKAFREKPRGAAPSEEAPFKSNLADADKALALTPQEKALYKQHLTNLTGPGGVNNEDGTRSSLFQTTVGVDDKFFTIPTVWDGKKHSTDEAVKRAAKEGWDKYPSYDTQEQAEKRYGQLHDYMEKDTAAYQQQAADRAPTMPDKGSSWADLYAKMSPQARAHLITNARTALHATLQQETKDAEAYAERTGELPIDTDGKTVRDKIARILTPNQVTKANLVLDAAVGRYKATAGLSDLDDAQAERHIRSLAPEEEAKTGLPYAIAAKNQAYAVKAYQKIADLRGKDPGQAAMGGPVNVAGVPKVTVGADGQLAIDEGDTGNIRTRPAREVQDAIRILNGKVPDLQLTQNEDGSITAGPAADPQARTKAIGVILDARIAAQKRWGVPSADQRAISLKEAQSLLDMRNASSLSADEFQTKLTEATQRAKDTYGPYAGRALSDAVKLIVKDRQNKETGLDLAAQLITGRIDPDTLLQQRAARAFDDRWWKSGQPSLPSGEQGQRGMDMIRRSAPDQPTEFDPWMNAHGVGPAREAPETPQGPMGSELAGPGIAVPAYPKPSERQLEWLKKNAGNPSARTVFDSKFGPGATKRYGSER